MSGPNVLRAVARIACPDCGKSHDVTIELDRKEVERALTKHLRGTSAERKDHAAEQAAMRSQERAGRDAASVYVIRNTRSGLVKIGRSIDVNQRLAHLRMASGDPLELIATVGTGGSLEFSLHRQFRAARRQGEWFDPAHPDIAPWIESLSSPAERT